jgi:aryl-alcohol dehydrogenase-like predicted oxidoreductase
MDYVRLGRTGLKVSRLCFGCMSYGDPAAKMPWTLGFDESRPFYRRAVEAGINFFDTADTYAFGSSEDFTGRLVREFMPRDEAVIATKVFNPTQAEPGPNGQGLSRKHIMSAIDGSLKRLGTDYVDLYIVHRFDRHTPVEETMEALHDVVKAGKARYIGASSMHAYQFVQMQYVAEMNGWTRFVAMQNLYNLVWREEERDMNAFCIQTGVALTPWSPLAGGFLARDWRVTKKQDSPRTTSGGSYSNRAYETPADYKVVDALIAVAKRHNRPMAQIALAWVLERPGMTSPIIGATKLRQLEDALAALEVTLTDQDRAELDNAYSWNRLLGMLR